MVPPLRVVFRDWAIVLCLFARFLFVGSDPSMGHASLISIVEQFMEGRTSMPLCLGELFLALDRFKWNPHASVTGCPCLLQILLARGSISLSPQLIRRSTHRKGLFARKRALKPENLHGWALALADRNTRIRWVVPWLNIKEMICSERSPYVKVTSLSVLTFYCPFRVMRQFGLRQLISEFDFTRLEEKPIVLGIVQNWEKDWGRRLKTAVTPLIDQFEGLGTWEFFCPKKSN